MKEEDNNENEKDNYFLFPFDTNYFLDNFFGYKDASNNSNFGSSDHDDKKPTEGKSANHSGKYIDANHADKYLDLWIAYRNFMDSKKGEIPFEVKKAKDLNDVLKYFKSYSMTPMSDLVDKIAKKKTEEDLKINDININVNLGFDTSKVESSLISALESLMDAVDGLLGFLYSRKDRRSER